jgi:putative transcriptional regulator
LVIDDLSFVYASSILCCVVSGQLLAKNENLSAMKNYLKVARAKKDLTQAALAEKIGVSRQAVNNIENGNFNPSTLLALKMAKVLNASVEELFELEQQDF